MAIPDLYLQYQDTSKGVQNWRVRFETELTDEMWEGLTWSAPTFTYAGNDATANFTVTPGTKQSVVWKYPGGTQKTVVIRTATIEKFQFDPQGKSIVGAKVTFSGAAYTQDLATQQAPDGVLEDLLSYPNVLRQQVMSVT